jgi:uncharacterized protein with HEPN domain
MVGAIDLIRQWTDQEGSIENVLRAGSMSQSAVERQVLIISEAAIRVHHAEPAYLQDNAPEIDWSGIRGVGNFIRHRYNQVDLDMIERILRNHLDPLEAACRRLLAMSG